MSLFTYSVSALPKAKPIKWTQLVLRPLLSPAGFYEAVFYWLTGAAEQGNPSLHGLVGMTDANMLLLSPDSDTIITLTQLERERRREETRARSSNAVLYNSVSFKLFSEPQTVSRQLWDVGRSETCISGHCMYWVIGHVSRGWKRPAPDHLWRTPPAFIWTFLLQVLPTQTLCSSFFKLPVKQLNWSCFCVSLPPSTRLGLCVAWTRLRRPVAQVWQMCRNPSTPGGFALFLPITLDEALDPSCTSRPRDVTARLSYRGNKAAPHPATALVMTPHQSMETSFLTDDGRTMKLARLNHPRAALKAEGRSQPINTFK